MLVEWPTIKRDQYLRMLDRHWPFWAGLTEFIQENKVQSAIEVGCGVGHLAYFVDRYTGVDTNAQVIEDNAENCRGALWFNLDWREAAATVGTTDLFVAASVIEHCESFEPLLEWVISLPVKYSVVTFHKGLGKEATIQRDKDPLFHDNRYSRADVEKWLRAYVISPWHIFDLPLSRARFKQRRDSVLVIDRTGKADLSMWSKRELHGS